MNAMPMVIRCAERQRAEIEPGPATWGSDGSIAAAGAYVPPTDTGRYDVVRITPEENVAIAWA